MGGGGGGPDKCDNTTQTCKCHLRKDQIPDAAKQYTQDFSIHN